MDFLIVIRHAISGLEKQFPTLQHIADFLDAQEDRLEWHGHEALGPLPEPTKAPEAPWPAFVAEAEAKAESLLDKVEGYFHHNEPAEPNTGL